MTETSLTLPERDTERHAWPFAWIDATRFLVAYVVMAGVWISVGLLIDGPLDGSVGARDRRIAANLASHRTSTGIRASHWCTLLAETGVKVVVTLVVAIVILAVWRSWSDVAIVVGSLILEASVFLTVTLVVGRHRPNVDRLDGSPVGSSYPSGHTGAAAAYAAFAVVMWRRAHHRAAMVIGALVVVVVAAVGWSRMYRGMHYLTDVTAGLLLGFTSVAVVVWIVEAAERRAEGVPT